MSKSAKWAAAAIALAAAALLVGPAQGASAAQAPPTPAGQRAAPGDPVPGATPAPAPGPARGKAAPQRSTPGPVPAGDEVTTATGDQHGYHIYAASAGGHWSWQPLATLQPGGQADQQWIGQQCLTGDGRYVIAVVAPWAAQNTPAGIAQGGLAYAVDAHTGAARPLATRLALTSSNPGCGLHEATLTRYTTADQSRTEVLTADPATGRTHAAGELAGQFTSAVPVDGDVIGAVGATLTRFAPGRGVPIATLPGQVFRLTANSSGGVDFLAVEGAKGDRNPPVGVYTFDGRAVHRSAGGPLSTTRLYPGKDGHNTIVGPAGFTTGSAAAKIRGQLDTGAGPAPALPAPATPFTAIAADAVFPPSPNTTAPTCAVGRNDPNYQVPQPSSSMIEWATNHAAHGTLVGPGGSALRADGKFNLHTGAYSPSADFPLHGSFGPGADHIPREILDGVFAQESNWHHASPHAPPGVAGNPYIADYYGYSSAGSIDYNKADCGYGLGQVTDRMRLPDPSTPATAQQQRIAVDYAENAAAAAQILTDKWNQLKAAGITVDINNPGGIEEWYFALWAYNSGVNPQQSTGNTSGCTPGPGCTDADGNWGLGWTNNPANPNYDPQRHPFLHAGDGVVVPAVRTYGDAAHPQDWPYQEKVFGWIETPQLEPSGTVNKYPGTFDYVSQSGFFLYLPSTLDFCGLLPNSCLPNPLSGAGSCQRADYHCWWHGSTLLCPLTLCHGGVDTVADSAPEPTVANPHPPVCSLDLPAETLVIDEQPTDINLAGCPTPSAWQNSGTFTWTPNTDSAGAAIGLIDLHQLGVGFGGRMEFTHLEAPADAKWGGTASWTLNGDYDAYQIRVFVPDIGAAGTLYYDVIDGLDRKVGDQIPVNQNNYANEWVSLGTFYLAPGAKVQTTNVVSGGDGATDVAFDAVAFTPVPSYVSLGDSYSSGEGAGAPYDPGTDTSSNKCHRSDKSYARVWAQHYGAIGVPVVQLACSGATVDNLANTGMYGEPAQIPATPKHAALVFLTIGGNDAGFKQVLTNCLTYLGCESFYTQNNTDNLDAKIQNLGGTLSAAYQQLHNRVPDATVTVLTYPNIFTPTTTGSSCLFQTGASLSAQDIQWLISEANHLDNVIERAANPLLTVAGKFLVQDERWAFAGHEICSAAPDVNGLVGIPPASESFHPNQIGYTKEADDLGTNGVKAGNWQHYASLRSPLPGTPDSANARTMLGLLPRGVYTPGAWSAHARAYFNQNPPAPGVTAYAWGTWPGQPPLNGCKTNLLTGRRDDDSGAANPPSTCPNNTYADLAGDQWYTPYDNPQVTVTPNNTNNKLRPQADHVVTLKDAWSNGASGWTQGLRYDFANDWRGIELVTASATTNGSKQDKSIEEWQPPNQAYLCAYAGMWVAVKYEWNLQVDDVTVYTGSGPGNGMTELTYLTSVLSGCP